LMKSQTPQARETPDLRSPGKMLVLEPSGNMVIHRLANDLIEVEKIKNPKNAIGGMDMYNSGMSSGM
ncbi:MAG: hypothetical protein ACRCUY_09270, partial [Thermoguttaceae bacterium]